MKPNKEQIATLSKMEIWAKTIKKETEGWRNKVEAEFKKEVREVCSAPYDIKSSLCFDIPFALEELLDNIETVKEDLEL